MKIRKTLLLMGLTAALVCSNVFAALADEDVDENPPADEGTAVEDLNSGWVQNEKTGIWTYYRNGELVRNEVIKEVNDRGGDVYYYVDENGVMVTNTKKVINDVEYDFDEEGAYVLPYKGAPTGTTSGKTFRNTWFNMMLSFLGTEDREAEMEDNFTGDDYAAIGSPKSTLDIYIDLGDIGEMQIYYLDLEKVPNMDAATFATTFANLEKGKNGVVGAAENVTIGGQSYVKISTTKKKNVITRYCRKQGPFMVIIETSGYVGDEGARASVVNDITPVQ